MEGAISRIAVVLGWLFDDTSEGVRRGGGGGRRGLRWTVKSFALFKEFCDEAMGWFSLSGSMAALETDPSECCQTTRSTVLSGQI